jgi:hypothetical protein
MPTYRNQPAFLQLQLRDIVAERTATILGFIGAGMSVDAGAPTWASLKEALMTAARGKIESMDESGRRRLEAKLAVATEEHAWLAMQMIREVLGETSWNAEVRNALRGRPNVAPGPLYDLLWALRPTGVFNLNLDRLATKALVQRSVQILPNEFVGKEAKNRLESLRSTTPYVVNLHGILDDSTSWVLTKADLDLMQEDEAYQQFVRTALLKSVIVFLGLSVDDIAVGGILNWLASRGMSVGPHFWITHRTDASADAWAESVGIRVIRYNAIGGDHSELKTLLQDLVSHVPQELEAPPVMPSASFTIVGALPSPEELERRPSAEARELLNAHLKRILSTGSTQAMAEYSDVVGRYRRAIYNAWYINPSDPDESLLGYRLESTNLIGKGAFGRVYRAVTPDGRACALKLAREELRDNPAMLASFRRGVRSMKILADSNVAGMVRYFDAAEVPAFVAMELIEGPNLAKAVESGYAQDWEDKLSIGHDLAQIVHSAHQLPERVLHRDLRPANVMLKNCYSENSGYEVVVLDFDLSWHRDAMEQSITMDGGNNAYLAPEQFEFGGRYSTRSALVDSFGIGMTMFFICTGRNPKVGQYMSQEWSRDIERAMPMCRNWVSLPRRIARLISFTTRLNQDERWDLGQVTRELNRLKDILSDPSSVRSAELLAEEVVARCGSYVRNEDGRFRREGTGGVELVAEWSEGKASVSIRLSWIDQGTTNRRAVGKYIGSKAEQAIAELRRGGWSLENKVLDTRQLNVEVSMGVEVLAQNIVNSSSAVQEALRHISF